MMKKLVMLALVMSFASLATAGLVSLNVQDKTVTVVASGFTAYEGFANFVVFTVPTTAPVLSYAGAGSEIVDMAAMAGGFEGMLSLDAGAVKGAYQLSIMDSTDPFAVPNGVLFTAVASGAGTAYLLDQGGTVLGSVQIIPEPATMALLGLGVLALRRKK